MGGGEIFPFLILQKIEIYGKEVDGSNPSTGAWYDINIFLCIPKEGMLWHERLRGILIQHGHP